MKEVHTQKASSGLGTDSFFDPESIFSLMEAGSLFEPKYPESLRLALWLEYFLRDGAQAFKEKWRLLPPDGNKILGMTILKCYLHQPLFLPVLGEGKGRISDAVILASEKKGKLLQVSYAPGSIRDVKVYYPLQHHRLWPDLLEVLKEVFLPLVTIFEFLEKEVALASVSRLDHLRQRAETLRNIFSTQEAACVIPPQTSEASGPLKEEEPSVQIEDILVEEHKADDSFQRKAPISTSPPVPDKGSKSQEPTKKKRRRKSSEDQMKLF
jgi:hypothetical protein